MTLARRDEGGTLELTASTALTSGAVLVVQDTIGIVADSVAAGAEYRLFVEGKFELAKNTGVTLTAGEDVYWDATPGELTTNKTNGTRIGVAVRAASTLASKGRILLNHPNIQLDPQT